MSLHQERLWFLDQLERGNPVYHLAEAFALSGPLERTALEDALSELLRRHEVLRTRISAVDGRPSAVIAPARGLALPLYDLGMLPPDARRAEVRRRALAHARRPFDLERGPLLRAALLRLSDVEHVLLLSFHRLAADAGSPEVVRRELLEALPRAPRALSHGQRPPLTRQYADVARRQRQWLRGEDCARQLAWWRGRLAGAPAVIELPTDHARGAVSSYRGARRSLALPATRSEALLLAAFKVLLLRTTGQQEIVVGFPVANRGEEDDEALIGPFENPLVLRTDLSDDPEIRQLVERISTVDRTAREHRDLPFEKLVEELQPDRDLNREPLFQVRFVFRDAPPPDLRVRRFEIDYQTAEFDWTLEVEAGERTLTATLEYDADLFDATTIGRALGHYRILLEGIAADPARRLSELPLLGDAERHQLLTAWNDTRRPYPDQSPIHALFEAQAAATPEAVAAVFADEQVTYRELNRRANQLAHSLRTLGVGRDAGPPEVGVGLCVERSVEMLVGILGILKAGGAYVPLDPSYPAERLTFMLEDVRMPVLVSQRRLLETLPISSEPPELRLLCLDEPVSDDPENPSRRGGAENLAYVMYTSGSTGLPKGVGITHRGVVRLIKEANYADLNDQVFLQFAPISFDASTLEIWGALLTGGRLVIFPAHTPSLEELGAELDRHRVTTLWLTSGLFHQMVDESPQGLSAVRQLLAGGDVLSARHVRRVLEKHPGCTLINGYGPTESTTFTACLPMRRPGEVGEPVSIGRPITHTRVYVLDRQLQPVGIGVFGELYIAGDGLARGYLNRPQLTAEHFVPSPWGRLYRTGDVVRFLADGRLEFLGRRDDQVKVRGFRIELGEVEAHLGRHPGVRESAVVVRDDRAGGKRLVAFVLAQVEAPAAAELRDFLRRTLPDYMVPGVFIPLESLPLTPNGKVDRAALGRTTLPAPAGAEEPAEPRTAVEEMVATIWAEVLELERVGIHDDFFELGGHSLLATRVISRVRETFEVDLPLRIFFEAATIGTMAAQIETARREQRVLAASSPVPVPRDEPLPLSFAQQRLWFLDQYQPQSAIYNIYYAFRLRGPLDRLALEQSLNEIVRRHEVLRTRLAAVGGEPRQHISEPRPFPLPVVDLTTMGEDELLRLAAEQSRRPFDLAAGPLLRAALLRTDRAEHVFLLNIHHVATDGWSMGLFYRELEVLYGARSPLPELPIQYADFALWQRNWLRGEVRESQLAYWKRQLDGMEDVPELPADRPRPAVQSYRGAMLSVTLPRALIDSLKALSHPRGATLFMALLAALDALLSRITGEDDVAVGSAIANRNRPEIEGLIGFFVNTLLLRADLRGDPSFRELLDRVRQVALGAFAHQDLPFEQLVEELQPHRDLSRQPLFQVMFVLQNTPGPGLQLPGLEVSAFAVHNGTAKFDLALALDEEAGGGLSGFFEYNTDLFDATTIRRLAGHLATLLAELVATPDRRLSALGLLTPPERHQLLAEWRDRAARVIPEAPTLSRFFELRAERTPDAVAMVSGDECWSFGQLDARADQLADHLRSLGVAGRPETVVGIAAERGPETVVGLMGILKAGGVYLPLDPTHPTDRLAFLLRDAGARIVLARSSAAGRLPPPEEHGASVVDLDGVLLPSGWQGQTPPAAERTPDRSFKVPRSSSVPRFALVCPGNEPDHLAYVIYTSGTTGVPKGVAVSHRQLLPVHAWFLRYFDLGERSRVLQNLSPCFDFGVFELLTTLFAGGRLVFLPAAEQGEPARYLDAVERHALNTVHTTPSFFRELISRGRLAGLEIVHLGGEAVSRDLVRRIEAVVGEPCRVYNGYGPTEASINSTVFRMQGRPLDRGVRGPTVPIGRPTANNSVYVLDRRGRPQPVGVPGELAIGGDGLARTYLNRPALTAERFVPAPGGEGSGRLARRTAGRRVYRSGDLVRWLADGELEFLGRIDHQVKIRGLRIELGEIEAALARHPAVRQAVVSARDRTPAGEAAGERWLVAYVVRREGSPEVDAGTLRGGLGESLPAYMVPSAVVWLNALPRTATGKVDRRALPAPESRDLAPEAAFVAPRDPLEDLLAGIWEEVLGATGTVGVHDDFFALGGHSLLATQVLSRVAKTLRVEAPVRALFEHSTVAALARYLSAALRREQAPAPPPLRPAARTGPPPLSFAQERLWFFDRFAPGSALYNVPIVLRLDGRLDPAALERALSEIVRRHEVLRATFETVDGRPVQVIRPDVGLPLPVVDLAGTADPQRRLEADRLARAEAREPFDLVRGPVVRTTGLRLGPVEHTLLLTVHHIAFDGWSIGVFLRELTALYGAFVGGSGRGLPELGVQYADFAHWQRHWLAGEVLESQLGYWREQLAELPVLELPTDQPRPALQSFRGAAESFRLPAELGRSLTELSRRSGTTLFMTLLAAFQTLLGRISGRADLAVGTAVANRNRTEIEGLLGFFVNTLVLRTELRGNPSFQELLTRVREVTLEAYAHQDLPFEKLVEELEPERDLSHNPLVQVHFVLQNAPLAIHELAPGLGAQLGTGALGQAKFDLIMALEEEEDGGLSGDLEYSTDLFDAPTIRRRVGHFRTLLASAVALPDARLPQLPLLAAAERHQLVREWSHAPHDAPGDVRLDELLAAPAVSRPDAIAVVSPAGRLSYGELRTRADRLAAHLRSLGVGPEVLVGLFLERSAEALVGILGVLKAGGAYLPLDPAYPRERLAFMLQDSGVPVVLTRERLAAQLPPHRATVVRLDADGPAFAGISSEGVASAGPASNLAYAIYTSGSTGRPKGVLVAHRGVCEMASALARRYDVTASSRVLLWASLSFDAAVAEIFTTLLAGGTLCLGTAEDLLPGPDLVRFLRAHEVTNLTLVPSALQAMPIAELPALRSLVVAGEACRGQIVAPWMHGRRLVNAYGPTEASVCTSAGRVTAPAGVSPPIGRPVAGSRVCVLDRELEPVPIGVPGELLIGGGGLARGYLGRPALAAERFIPDPVSREAGARLYRSGDLVRFLADGELEFLGRIDQQLKVRGFRIEPGEIEALLAGHPSVREAVLVAAEEPGGAVTLVAYLVPTRPGADVEALRRRLRERVPEYMVPAAFVVRESLPRTPSGKVDRTALSRSAWTHVRAEQPFAAPRSPVEEVLAGIWTEVLNRPGGPIGVHDNFFELGGHSLLATQVVSRVRNVLGVELAVRSLFEQPTVAAMAVHLERVRGAAPGAAAPPIAPVPRDRALPLSFSQQRLWFLDRMAPGSAVYNIPVAFQLDGGLELPALERSLGEITARHEALRTTFREPADGADPVQWIAPPLAPELPPELSVVDLERLPETVRQAAARRLSAEEAEHPFDLTRGPLLRSTLLRLDALRHRLLLTMHHIVSDGWSMGIFTRELRTLYRAFAAGRPSPLPALALQYADFAHWQRRWLRGAVLAAQLATWRGQLAGAPTVLELPCDRPRPAVESFRGAHQGLALPAPLSAAVKGLSRRRGVTPFMTLLAAFAALLGRTTGQRDLLVGTPVANRNRAEIEDLIGLFVNTLVLRCDLADDPTYRELLERIREVALAAYGHQDLPFEKLVGELEPDRDLSRSPLFQVMFLLQNAPGHDASGLELTPVDIDLRTSKFDLSFFLEDTGETLVGAIERNIDLFDATTVQRFAAHFRVLLAAAVADPERGIWELPLLAAAEERQLVDAWNDTGAACGRETCLHQLFAAQVGRTPEAVAVVCGRTGARLTYRELDARAERLAAHLRALGVGPEVRVGVFAERSPALVAGLLAILKAGGGYVPLDPAYPRERLAFMLEDAGAAVLLTQEKLRGALGADQPGIGIVDLDAAPAAGAPAAGATAGDPVQRPAAAGNLAYLIYTSGSTGRPKAVAIEHRTAVAMVHWAWEVYSAAELAGVLASTSICFDISIFELFVPLTRGGRAILVPDALHLPALAGAAEVTLINTVPSAMTELVRLDAVPPSVRTINLAGEALAGALVRELYRRPTVRRVLNLYGPSEDTTYSTWCEIGRRATGEPAIGRPLANTRVHLVDRRLRLVPIGVPGELTLSGAGLTRGYLNRPALTAERFCPDPFSPVRGGRLYRTGDLARYRPDGVLEYLGRRDHQVKIRGYRIELGEIELALAEHPGIRDAVVVARREAADAAGLADQRLVAYLVTPAEIPAESELRAFLGRKLADYMLPSAFVALAALPLTPSGKVDRGALSRRQLPASARACAERLVAPRDPVEEMLAGIWTQVLGPEKALAQLGVHDNFFALGGHSLLATRVLARIRTAFAVELPLAGLFEAPTIAELAARVREAMRAGGELPAAAVERVPRAGELPLSFAQERLWFLDRYQPDSPIYNLPAVYELAGRLHPAALAGSLRAVVRRHETLRTTFHEGPRQHITAELEVGLPLVDLRGLPAAARPAAAAALAEEEARRPFDLGAGPLLRAALLRLEDEGHRLLLTLHHIISDGWSMEVLMTELAAFYAERSSGRPGPGLPELPIQYADFAVWQRRWLRGAVLDRQLAYWRGRLEGAPTVLELLADRPRPPVQSYRGAGFSRPLPAALAEDLKALGQRRGTTLFMTALAAFAALLHRYTGQPELVVGSPVANRGRAELEGLIGLFINTLVLRVELAGDPSFQELLGQVRATALGAYVHQDLPFERLVDELQPQRDLSRSPLFQVMFILDRGRGRELEPGLSMRALGVDTRTAKFDLTLHLLDAGPELVASVVANTDLFDRVTAERLLAHFERLLGAVAAAPHGRICELPLVAAAEAHALLREWNDTATRDRLEPCVHELFELQAALRPDALAAADRRGMLSYGELGRRADRLARQLRRWGVGPEVVVPFCLERSTTVLVAMLGILKAGGAYLPLDSGYPVERLSFMLADSGAAVVLTQERLAATVRKALPEPAPGVIVLDGTRSGDFGNGIGNGGSGAGNLAYVIYTSGSTGRPKGVEIRHSGLVNLVRWHQRTYAVTPGDRATQVAGLSFDASVREIWPYLTAGASLHIPDEETRTSPEELLSWLAAEAITLGFQPTPMAEALLAEPWPRRSALRALLTGGDRLLKRPAEGSPGGGQMGSLPCGLFNHYGPTENTVVTTAGRVRPQASRLPAIGRPLANTAVYVVDPRLGPVPIGVVGELVTRGVGLARGYRRRPALTAERFVPDPLSGGPWSAGGRLYRTGDLVRWRGDGRLEFLGRIDHQVKIRGFRIELGEIEVVLGEHPGVAEAVVIPRQHPAGGKRLVAWVVAAEPAAPAVDELRRHLAARLPDYMVPALLVRMEGALPLLPSGKVNRGALAHLPLPESEWDNAAAAGAAMAPRSPVEEGLAEIWSEVLGRDRTAARIGVHDDFFELGGHSLLAAQVISRVRTTFGIELPLRRLFEKPTVAALAHRVAAALAAGDTSPLPAIEPVPRQERMPLSFAQQRLWFLDRLEPGDPTFNMPFAARVPGAPGRAALARSLAALVARHEALRTSFPAHQGKPYQRIAAAQPLRLPLVDLRRLPRAAREGEARRLAGAEGRRSFDLARGPLLRATLVRCEPRVHLLLLTMHHIIADGWSIDVLLRELSVLYAAFSAGRPSPLPELRVQYADCAVWQQRWLGAEALAAQLAYWRQQLAGPLPVLELEADGPRRAGTKRGATCSLRLPEDLAAGLRSLSREAGATLFMTLLAAFATLLHRTTGQTDLLVGTPVANRNRGESEGLIGLFVNTLVLRTDLGGDPRFRELVDRVREVALGAYAHSDMPFEKLVEELHPQRASSRSPLFQVMMTLHQAPAEGRRLGELALEPLETHNRTSQFDLTLVVVDHRSELDCGLEYDRDLFEPATAERILKHFQILLEEVVADSERRLSELAPAGEPLRRRRSEKVVTTEAAVTEPEADSDRQARLSQRRAGLSAKKRELLQRRLKLRQVDP